LSSTPLVIQDDSAADEESASPTEIEKYVAVYKAMQRDRTLTVDAAAAQQGMSLVQFRHLEAKIQDDEAAVQHVRDELQGSAHHAKP
jgi:hypothetical protein